MNCLLKPPFCSAEMAGKIGGGYNEPYRELLLNEDWEDISLSGGGEDHIHVCDLIKRFLIIRTVSFCFNISRKMFSFFYKDVNLNSYH